ncbi:MAG: uroporphyrinogen-III synthase [Bdellovibrionales bacterium]
MLLVTRPQPSAADTAARLKRRGFRVVVSPQLQASFKKPRAVSAAGHIVVVTSPQAARALANWPQLHHLPALAVGDGTKKLLLAAGFRSVASAAGDAVALVQLVRKKYKKRKFLLAVAPSTGQALAAALRRLGHSVQRISVYTISPVVDLPAGARRFLKTGRAGGVLFYSPRTARAFAQAVKKARLTDCTKQLKAYCLSAAIAKAAKRLSWKSVAVAKQPTEAALLALLPQQGRHDERQRSQPRRPKARR